MANDTVITVIGNITHDLKDDDLRNANGNSVINLSIAATPSKFNKETGKMEQDDSNTVFHRLAVWRKQAENVLHSLKRGQRVIAQGRIRANNWTDNSGNKRHDQVIEVFEIGPSLLFGQTEGFTKTVSGGGGGQSGSYFGGGNDSANQNQSSDDGWGASTGNDADQNDDPPF